MKSHPKHTLPSVPVRRPCPTAILRHRRHLRRAAAAGRPVGSAAAVVAGLAASFRRGRCDTFFLKRNKVIEFLEESQPTPRSCTYWTMCELGWRCERAPFWQLAQSVMSYTLPSIIARYFQRSPKQLVSAQMSPWNERHNSSPPR